jgi:transposase
VDCSTRNQSTEIEVKNLDHLGLVAGIIDEIGIVEIINEQVSIERGEIVTAGQVVKAIILNGLGFVSRALYLFPQFFEDKATEHLLGEGIEAKHLNDDKIGRFFGLSYATYRIIRNETLIEKDIWRFLSIVCDLERTNQLNLLPDKD